MGLSAQGCAKAPLDAAAAAWLCHLSHPQPTSSNPAIVKLRCLDDLRAMHVFPRVDAPIHSLSLTPEERVVLVRTKTQD